MRNSSTRLKGKKISGLAKSKFGAQRYGDIRLEKLEEKNAGAHFMQTWFM